MAKGSLVLTNPQRFMTHSALPFSSVACLNVLYLIVLVLLHILQRLLF